MTLKRQNPTAPAVRDDALYIPASPNAVPDLGNFCQVQPGHSSLAPKSLCNRVTDLAHELPEVRVVAQALEDRVGPEAEAPQ
jgi:hypothetical protein